MPCWPCDLALADFFPLDLLDDFADLVPEDDLWELEGLLVLEFVVLAVAVAASSSDKQKTVIDWRIRRSKRKLGHLWGNL